MLDERATQLEILHEITMGIGASLDTREMLARALPLFLRRLDGTMVSVLAQDAGEWRPVQTLPRSTDSTFVAASVDRHLRGPGRVVELQGRYVHAWPLPGFGLLLLTRSRPLSDELRFELDAIATKLALALRACAQYEELRDAQSRLAESEERWKFALEGAGDGMWDWNPRTDEAHFSEQYKRMLGYADDEFPNTGITWFETLHPDDAPAVRDALDAHFKGERPHYEVEFRCRCKNGSWKWILARGKVVRRAGDGSPLRMLGTHKDIDARKAGERELERYRTDLETLVNERTAALIVAKDAAEAASRAKSAFLANMSHELRTPLGGIMGLTSLAREQSTDPKLTGYLDRLDQCSSHLLAIVNDVLDLARIEADRLVLDAARFDLDELFARTRAIIEPQAQRKGLGLRFDPLGSWGNRRLIGDCVRLGQVLVNLVGNAIKFTDAGQVSVRVRVEEEGPEAVRVRFEIVDTGIGIAEVDRSRLFVPFEQLDGSHTRRHGGAGLGLSISQRLVRLMGGAIGVESDGASGSTFWFVVPLRLAPRSAPPKPRVERPLETAQKATLRGRKILVVDDDPLGLSVAGQLLEHAGLEVTLASSGEEAVDCARSSAFDLVLMDLQMPGLTGFEAARAIRASGLSASAPILALTASAFDEDRRACLEAGMNDHVSKPFDARSLRETIARWLDTSRGVDDGDAVRSNPRS